MANLIIWNSLNQGEVYNPRSIGAYQIASWARQCGYTVEVIEYSHRYSAEELSTLTKKFIDDDTLAIGVSSTFWRNTYAPNKENYNNHEPEWVIYARTLVQEIYPKLSWILGGVNTQSTKINTDYFDWIKINTDFENSIVKTLNKLSGKIMSDKMFDVKEIQPVFVESDCIEPYEVLPIELGRGCQFKCKFCRYELIGKKPGTYLRHSELLEAEIVYNYQRWGTTRYFFLDDTVNESEEKIKTIINIREKTGIPVEWIGYCRLDLIGTRPNSIKLLEESGLKGAYLGIESFDPTASKLVGKGWNGVHGQKFLLKLQENWQNRISFTLAFIIGIGSETIDSILNTHQWCIENNIPRWRYSGLQLIRPNRLVTYSEFDKNSTQYGYRFTKPLDDMFWENEFWTSSSASQLANELNQDSNKYGRFSAWQLGEAATTDHGAFNSILNTKLVELPNKYFAEHSKKNINKYYKKKIKL